MEVGALIRHSDDTYEKGDNIYYDDKGSKILATGSSSCIFRPNIPCKGDETNGMVRLAEAKIWLHC